MLIFIFSPDQNVIQIKENVVNASEDVLQHLLPRTWTRRQAKRESVIDPCPTPRVQGGSLVPVGGLDRHIEEGRFQINDTEVLAAMDVVSKIF